ncbi:MAG: OmpH family outer membrane protein [Deltaproteobacteria bacterium]|nr:OmpH family outer membrane protein [Deltaproteobacteria bacterium]
MHFVKKAVLIVAVMAICTAVPAFAGNTVKIGVIDFQKALKVSAAGQAFQKKIEKEGRKMEANLKEKNNEIDEIANQLDRGASVMDEDKRLEKQRDIEIKKYDYQTLSKKYQSKLRQMQSNSLAKIQKDMVAIVEKIGKEGGYTLILDKNAVVYNPGGVDITDELVKKYDKVFDGKLE